MFCVLLWLWSRLFWVSIMSSDADDDDAFSVFLGLESADLAGAIESSECENEVQQQRQQEQQAAEQRQHHQEEVRNAR